MKKIILFAILSFTVPTLQNCSSSNDEIEVKNDFTNTEYIKSQMIGRWNYWGHLSPSTNSWWYSGDVYKWYFDFKSDNTYTNKSLSSTIQTGTYSITPATKELNAVLYLNYTENNKSYTRKIYLKGLEGKTATFYESTFDERYEKQ